MEINLYTCGCADTFSVNSDIQQGTFIKKKHILSYNIIQVACLNSNCRWLYNVFFISKSNISEKLFDLY